MKPENVAYLQEPFISELLQELICKPASKDCWRPILNADCDFFEFFAVKGFIFRDENDEAQITSKGIDYLQRKDTAL